MASKETITIEILAKDLASGNIGGLISNMDKAARQGGMLGATMKGVGLSMGMSLNPVNMLANGVKDVVGAVVDAVSAANEFDAQMTLLQTQAGASADEVDKMKTAVLGLAGQVGQ